MLTISLYWITLYLADVIVNDNIRNKDNDTHIIYIYDDSNNIYFTSDYVVDKHNQSPKVAQLGMK